MSLFMRFSASMTLALSVSLAAATTNTVQTLRGHFPATFKLLGLAALPAAFTIQQLSEVAARAEGCPAIVPAAILLVVIPLMPPMIVTVIGTRYPFLLRLACISAIASSSYWAWALGSGGVGINNSPLGPALYKITLPFRDIALGTALLDGAKKYGLLTPGLEDTARWAASGLDELPSHELGGVAGTWFLLVGALMPLVICKLRGMRMLAMACVALTGAMFYFTESTAAPAIPGFCCAIASAGVMFVASAEMQRQEDIIAAHKAAKEKRKAMEREQKSPTSMASSVSPEPLKDEGTIPSHISATDAK